MKALFRKLLGSQNDRELKRLAPLVQRCNEWEAKRKPLSDAALRAASDALRERAGRGEPLDDLLPEAFATVREAAQRSLGQRHYDVQLVGGIALHRGKIAEMKTGEGKTLVATLPSYLNALTGHGIHIITVNDYLARRDAEWMGRVHRFLGLSVGCIVHDLSDGERQSAYGADITYGTNNEFAFDYLRDNMKPSLARCVQRGLGYGIVDEVDSILIDEARTPLIISGSAEENAQIYAVADRAVRRLRPGTKGEPNKDIEETGDFWFDEKDSVAALTEEGIHKVEKLLKISNLYAPDMFPVNHAVTQALVAHHLKKRDVDYVVKPGERRRLEVVIVDEFTGRLMPGRRWSEGLHQAIEAKEGIPIQSENQTLASITFQNYFRMYEKLAGMTGTADTEAPEFAKIYDLEVLVVPTHCPMIREDLPDVVYRTKHEKFEAVVEDIRARHETGQPVLVGTIAIETSEFFAKQLKRSGIPHNVLNAKQHEREAEIVAQAGRRGAVTISTNMAGRGTDIILGGNPEFLALTHCHHDREHKDYDAALERFRTQCAAEREEVLAAGGVHILGTERHESRRIDNQLRGRSGRQGDPGSSRFFLSLEDDLLRLFGSERISGWMERVGLEEGEAIEHRFLTRAIENAQKKVEARNFDHRKHLLEYDDVMNKQRMAFYGRRRGVLAAEDVHDEVLEMVEGIVVSLLDTHCPAKEELREESAAAVADAVGVQFGVSIDLRMAPFVTNGVLLPDRQHFGREVLDLLMAELARKGRDWEVLRERYPAAGMPTRHQLEHRILLDVLDRAWKDHLYSMDALRDEMRFRGYAQRDPKVEYAREGFAIFEATNQRIDLRTTEEVYKVGIDEERLAALDAQLRAGAEAAVGQRVASAAGAGVGMAAVAPREGSPRPGARRGAPQRAGRGVRPRVDGKVAKVGRNAPCPCGSGLKYKRCCGS